MHWHLYILMWVSGSWKWTLRKNLIASGVQDIEFLKSYVTRDMRPGEVDGDIYYFISEEEFKDEIAADNFLEYAFVHQAAYYGTKKSDVLDGIQDWKTLLTEMDMIGLEKIIQELPDFRKNYTTLFLDVPEATMKERNLERNPDTPVEELEKRAESMKHEREKAAEICDHIIDATQTPEKVMEDVLEIMKKEA